MTTTTSTTSTAYHLFVGIDIAMATASASWLSPGEAPSRAMTFEQSSPGFALLQQRLLATGHPVKSVLIVMEATGSYWITLATTLTQAGFAVSVVNPAQAHHFARALLKRAKTDAIDAQTLAQLAHLLQPAPWSPPPAVYAELQQRLAQRETLLALRQQVRNQLHALTHTPMVVGAVKRRMEHLIQTLTEQIEEVDAELELALAQDETWAASAARLQTITGIGPLVAAWLLVTTLNFTLCESAEALTSYAGLAPRPFQSGSSIHGRARIGHTGNARLRAILYMASLSAAQHNPADLCILRPVTSEPRKPMKVARCAAARKLLHLAFAVITNKEDFDPLYTQKQQQPA